MTTTSETTVVPTSTTLVKEVRVHPVVLASVIDMHMRRTSGPRVIGAISGVVSEDGAVIDITDCFPVTFEVSSEDGGTVRLDLDLLQQMKKQRKRTAPHESLVGWFSSMMEIPETSAIIHTFFCKETTTQTVCIMLCVDPNSCEFKTYVSDYSSKPRQMPIPEFFHEVPTHMGASDMERMTMSILCRADTKAQAESVPEVALNRLYDREAMFDSLRKMIATARECAKSPDDPKFAKVDPKVKAELEKVIARIEAVKPEDIDKVFTENVTDVLMVSYVTTLARNQLHFAQRLRNDLGKAPEFVKNLSSSSSSSSSTSATASVPQTTTATTTTTTTTTATPATSSTSTTQQKEK